MLIAQEVATQIVRSLANVVAQIAQRDAALADQVRRAGSSVLLNIVEGARRIGRDRLHFYRVSAGSAAEVGAALEVAVAWSYVTKGDVAETLQLIDRELALLWGLTRKRA